MWNGQTKNLCFNAVQNNTSLKPVHVKHQKCFGFNAVQNNTSLKLGVMLCIANGGFNAVQNNTSLKHARGLFRRTGVLMQFKITHL